MDQSWKIGFIGLGIMGRSMAYNLYRAGFDVTVWNRTESKVKEAEKWGAKTASSPKELSKTCHLVITMVGDTDDVRQVAEGENGLIHGAGRGLIGSI